MCGIAGFVDLAQGISCGALEAMNNVARYRGPDDEGYVFFSRTGAPEIAFGSETAASTRTLAPAVASVGELVHRDDRVIGLAHRRLSIIDVAPSGHQPMIDEATGCALVFNGEIYNYPEVRAKLEGIGAVFSTESDTEVCGDSRCGIRAPACFSAPGIAWARSPFTGGGAGRPFLDLVLKSSRFAKTPWCLAVSIRVTLPRMWCTA